LTKWGTLAAVDLSPQATRKAETRRRELTFGIFEMFLAKISGPQIQCFRKNTLMTPGTLQHPAWLSIPYQPPILLISVLCCQL
jgi:hypothetical protein